jgi:hypothetical protein
MAFPQEPASGELGIRVPPGNPGALENAAGDLRTAAGTMNRVAGQIRASSRLPGWDGLAAWSFADMCVDDATAAGRAADTLLAAARITDHLATELREARRATKAALEHARDADRRHTNAQQHADDARRDSSTARGQAWMAELRIGQRALTGDPATADQAERTAALDAAARADQRAEDAARAARRAQQDLEDAQRAGRRAAEHYEQAARHAAAAINGLAGALPTFASPAHSPAGRAGGEGGDVQFLGPVLAGAGVFNNVREGLGKGATSRASALGHILRTSGSPTSRSAAARYLPGAGSWAKGPVRFAGRAALPVGIVIDFSSNLDDGRSVSDAAGRTASQTVGAVGVGALGAAACGTETVATLGLGAAACPVLIGGGAAVGGWFGGKVYDGGKYVIDWVAD